MNIIIDTSIIIATIIREPVKPFIVKATEGCHLTAPMSVHWEIGNAFSAMFKKNRLTLEQAEYAIKIYETIPIRLVDIALEEAIKVAKKLNIYAYDAYLVHCAIMQKAPLMTLDENLKRAALKEKVSLIEI